MGPPRNNRIIGTDAGWGYRQDKTGSIDMGTRDVYASYVTAVNDGLLKGPRDGHWGQQRTAPSAEAWPRLWEMAGTVNPIPRLLRRLGGLGDQAQAINTWRYTACHGEITKALTSPHVGVKRPMACFVEDVDAQEGTEEDTTGAGQPQTNLGGGHTHYPTMERGDSPEV